MAPSRNCAECARLRLADGAEVVGMRVRERHSYLRE